MFLEGLSVISHSASQMDSILITGLLKMGPFFFRMCFCRTSISKDLSLFSLINLPSLSLPQVAGDAHPSQLSLSTLTNYLTFLFDHTPVVY